MEAAAVKAYVKSGLGLLARAFGAKHNALAAEVTSLKMLVASLQARVAELEAKKGFDTEACGARRKVTVTMIS